MTTETRHSHDGNWHDHEGGSSPHDHGYHVPYDPAAVPLTPRQAMAKRLGRAPDRSGSAAFSFGTIFIVFGALAFFYTQNSHAACSSMLVQALDPSQCSEVSRIWTLGVLGLVLGVTLIIVGAILRGKT